MNTLTLVWKNIKQQFGATLLSILLTAFGVAILCVIYITSEAFDKQLSNNSKNVDLVVGAKGSPLQLILSSLYHVDNPTGNIPLDAARKIAQNPFVELAVPISLGDNFKGHRLIGTEPAYLDLLELSMQEGKLWSSSFEAVIGSDVARKQKLKIGDSFHTAHGLTNDGHIHEEHPFKVVGILKSAGSVADNLILCDLVSVWDVHGIAHTENSSDHDHHEHDHDHAHDNTQGHVHEDVESIPDTAEVFVKNMGEDMLVNQGDEVTALLIKYRSPAAIGIVPKFINQTTELQAASPAIESSRLFALLGVGMDSLAILAYVIMAIAGLSIFISLYNALKERQFDLAIMRTLGASSAKLFALVIVEGIVITLIGGLVGLLLGHFALYIISLQTSQSADFIAAFTLHYKELMMIGIACLIGVVASLIPAWKAYNTTISTILSNK